MKRTRAILLVLLILLSAALPGSAQNLFPPQVKYQLEVLELRTAEERSLVLEAFEFQSSADAAELTFQMLTGGKLTSILGGIPFQATARDTQEQTGRLAAPAVIVSMGQTASLRVVEETLVPELSLEGAFYRTNGVEIKVTPVMVNASTGEIGSSFEIQTSGEKNIVRTNAILQNGEQLPLSVVRFALDGTDKTEERYFAVFVTAEIVEERPDTATLSIGGLGGMAGLLWPEEVVFHRENYVWVALPFGPIDLPEGGFMVGDRLYIRGDIQHASHSSALVGAGFALLPEGLDVEMQMLWDGGQAYLALGLADAIEAIPGLTLSGGIMPAVFDLAEFQRQKVQYWFEAYFDGHTFNFRLRYLSDLNSSPGTVQSEVGYKITENMSLFVKLSMHPNRGNRISSGLRLSF